MNGQGKWPAFLASALLCLSLTPGVAWAAAEGSVAAQAQAETSAAQAGQDPAPTADPGAEALDEEKGLEVQGNASTATEAPAAEPSEGVSFGQASVSADESTGKLTFSVAVSGDAQQVQNVSFECAGIWLQGVRGADGSWSATAERSQLGYKEAAVTVWAVEAGAAARPVASATLPAAPAASFGALSADDDGSGSVRISLSVTSNPGSVTNVAFEAADRWFQATRQADGSWAATVGRSEVGYGEAKLSAWACESGGSAAVVGTVTLAPYKDLPVFGAVSVTDDGSGSVELGLSVAEHPAGVSNVAFEAGGSWFQARRQADGSWKAVVGRDALGYGATTVVAWAQQLDDPRIVRAGSQDVAAIGFSASASVDDDQLHVRLSASGDASVTNVAFCVVNDATGAARWYQSSAQGASWGSTAAVSDFGRAGSYSVQVWAQGRSGVARQVASTSYTVRGATASAFGVTAANEAAGRVTLSVVGVSPASGVRSVAVEVWSSLGTDVVWTKATPQPDGTYAAEVDISAHGYRVGAYAARAWVARTNGVTNVVGGEYHFSVKARGYVAHIDLGGGRHRLICINPADGATGVSFRVWSEANGTDDEFWAPASYDGWGSWIYDFYAPDHLKNGGTVLAEAYYAPAGVRVGSTSFYTAPIVVDDAMTRLARNYGSSTSWLVLVDTTAHKVGVYRGGYPNWTRSFLWDCSNGADWGPTPKGVYRVGARGYSFSGDGHTCYYYTQFRGNYLFHSILYHQGTWNVLDGRLGYSISAGCVRLATENAKYLYDNLPTGSTVVIY